MAYSPSLADLPQSQGYTPSLADLPTPAQSNQGLLGSAASAIAPITAGANEFAGGSLSGLGSMLSNARSSLGSVAAPQLPGVPQASLALGNYNPGQALQNVGSTVTANAPTNYNGTQPTLSQQAIEGAAHYAPYVPQALDSLAAGAGKIASWLTGGLHDEAAQGLYGQLSDGLSKGDLNTVNNQNVLTNAQAQMDASKAAYTDFGNTVAQRGYAASGSPGIAGISELSEGNFIKPQATTGTIIDQAPGENPNEDLLKNLSSPTQKMIQNFNSSPTFDNAHLLQSQLGKEAANINAGLNTNIADKSQAKVLTTAKNALQSDIHSTFNANGDSDLSDQYQQLGQDFKNNVVPYMNVRPIWRAINNPQATLPNIANELAKPDTTGSRQTILQQLAQNPQNANAMVAQSIPKVGQLDSVGNTTTTANNLLTGYSNLPTPIKNIIPDQTNGLLQQLQSGVRTRQNLFKAANIGKAIGSSAAVIGGGIYGAHKLL